MITRSDEKQIIKMTRQGMSEAQIVRETGYSRNCVRRVMKIGRHRKTLAEKLAIIIRYKIDSNTIYGTCPTCRKQVALPCKACLTKQYNTLCEKPVQVDPISDDDASIMLNLMDKNNFQAVSNCLDLRPRELKRYKKVVEARAKHGTAHHKRPR